MKIFADVLLRVQAEKTVTISHCYGYVKAMYKSLEKFEVMCCIYESVYSAFVQNDSSSETVKKLRCLLDKRFERMMHSYLLDFDSIFIVAAALDPNTSNLLTENDYDVALGEIQNLVCFNV